MRSAFDALPAASNKSACRQQLGKYLSMVTWQCSGHVISTWDSTLVTWFVTWPITTHSAFWIHMLFKHVCLTPSSPGRGLVIPTGEDMEGMLSKALLVGNFEAAVNICISAGNMVGGSLATPCTIIGLFETVLIFLTQCTLYHNWSIYL